MADNTNLGSAANPAIHDDDPFAELTRIMGFDPREPVKPAVAAPSLAAARMTAVEPEPVQPPLPDLAIDLERELMGDFFDEHDDEEQVMASADVTPGEMTAPVSIGDEHNAAAVAEDAEPSASNWFRPVEVEADIPEVEVEPEFSAEAYEPVDVPVAELRHVADVPPAEAEMFAGDHPLDPEVFEASEIEAPASAQARAWRAAEDAASEADEAIAVPAETEAVVEAREPWFEPSLPIFDDWADQPVDAAALPERPGPAELAEIEAVDLASDDGFDDADDLDQETEIDMPPFEAATDHPTDPTDRDEDHPEPQSGQQPTHGHAHDQVVAAARSYLARQQPQVSAAAGAGSDAIEVNLEQELNALLGNTQAAEKNAAIEQARNITPVKVEQAAVEPESEAEDEFYQSFPEESRANAQPPEPVGVAPEDIDNDLDGLFEDGDFDAAISKAVEQESLNTTRIEPAEHVDMKRPVTRIGHDPYAALTALSAGLKTIQAKADFAEQPVHVNPAAQPAALQSHEMPEIETIDVPEPVIALADDLDLPDIGYEPEPRAVNPFDDIDSEFSNLLSTMAAPAAAAARPAVRATGFSGHASAPVTKPSTTVAAAPAEPMPSTYEAAYPIYSDQARPIDLGTVSRNGQASNLADMEFAYDPNVGEEMAGTDYGASGKPRSRWKGYAIVAAVGAVALIGAVGAYAVSFGGSGSQEIALIKADPSPVKVKPENPGGVAVPNQDSTVYDTVRGSEAAPTQEKLLASAEEPAPMPVAEDEPDLPMMGADDVVDAEGAADESETAAVPAPKAEDRVAQQDADDNGVDSSVEVAAVAPRKVRTMIVKADGTLVAREEVAQDPAVDSASEGVVDPMASNAVPAEATSAEPATDGLAAAASTNQETAAVANASEATGTPERAPIAPARPSDQPVDIVGTATPEPQEQQVASVEPVAAEPVAVPAGTYSMQIASQPTEASAQSSYKSLSRKYASVLDGHQARIVEADIAGKGKFWRVQVPVGSRKDAIKLCESYKSAGGSCFVSK